MIDRIGFNHFQKNPGIIIADEIFWIRSLYRNIDKIIRILSIIPKETRCLVCADLSLNFTTRSSLASHLRNHARATIRFWLDNFISKSPEELEFILYDGNRGVVDL